MPINFGALRADLEDLTDEQIGKVRSVLTQVVTGRKKKTEIPNQISALKAQFLETREAELGNNAWIQPTGAHDSYPRLWIVTYAGKTWESQRENNTNTPGTSGWREKTTGGPI